MYQTSMKEEFSRAFVKPMAACLGLKWSEESVDDDSVDFSLTGKIPGARIRNPRIDIQIKCCTIPKYRNDRLIYELPIKNYRDLRGDNVASPRYLIIVIAPTEIDNWLQCCGDQKMELYYCAYWFSLRNLPSSSNTANVTIQIPVSNILDCSSLKRLIDEASKGVGL